MVTRNADRRAGRRSLVVVALAAAALLFTPATGSMAVGGKEPEPVPPTTNQTKRATYKDGTRTCRTVAGPRWIGAVCTDSGTGVDMSQVIRDILDGDPLPECWHEPLTGQELRELGLRNGEGASWYWVTCLYGVDPETFEIDDEGAYTAIYYRRVSDDRVVELTENQEALIERVASDRRVPSPILGVSPSALPLVNQDVSFFNISDDELHVNVAAMGVQMRGEILELQVHPYGTTEALLTCDRNGYRAEPGETREDHRGGCWHLFDRSSLGLEHDAFMAHVATRWRVEINRGNGWEHFHTFNKTARQWVQVNEVQALVVP